MKRTLLSCVALFQIVSALPHAHAFEASNAQQSLSSQIIAEGPVAISLNGEVASIAFKPTTDDTEPISVYVGKVNGNGTIHQKVAIGTPRAIYNRDESLSLITTVTNDFGTDVIFSTHNRPKYSRHFDHNKNRTLAYAYDDKGHGMILSMQSSGVSIIHDDGRITPVSMAKLQELPSQLQDAARRHLSVH